MQFKAFPRRAAAVQDLAGDIAEALQAAVDARGRALFLATGGTTPAPIYRHLSELPLSWPRIDVAASDGRWLPEDDPGSNDGMIREALIRGAASGARLHPLFGPEPTPAAAVPRLVALFEGLPRPDMALLGMGEDGHIASLFPTLPEIGRLLDPDSAMTVAAVEAPGAAATPHRITLTLAKILTARAIRLIFFGEDKRAIYDRATADGPAGDLPVRGVLHQNRAPVVTYWAP